MNPISPFICGTLLVAMMAAGVSHYWSVQTFIANYPPVPAVQEIPINAPSNQSEHHKSQPLDQLTDSNLRSSGDTAQEEFFRSLLAELMDLKNDNRELRDLMAETNRNVMELAVIVDTHSESLRSLSTSEQSEDQAPLEINDDEFLSVLPPKASPVYPLDE
jgi:hypothetical protein